MNVQLLKLTSYSDRMQGDLVANFLQGCGIYVTLRSDDAGGIYNSMTASSGVHLYVTEEQYDEALLLLESMAAK